MNSYIILHYYNNGGIVSIWKNVVTNHNSISRLNKKIVKLKSISYYVSSIRNRGILKKKKQLFSRFEFTILL